MAKVKLNLTLTKEARDYLKKLAIDKDITVSRLVEDLARESEAREMKNEK